MAEQSDAASHSAADPLTPSLSEVRIQLERILGSRDFEVSERDHRFLEYVVAETLAGRGDRIKGYTIGVEVFGRDATFDPQSDPIVRIEAGRIRRALERYYLTAGSADPVVITIPKGGYIPAYSRRPEEERSEGRRPQAVPLPAKERRVSRPALWTLAAVVSVIGTWALSYWLTAPQIAVGGSSNLVAHAPTIPKLLVEPFENISGTKNGAILAKSVTMRVVDELSRFKDIVVVLIDLRRSDSAALTEGNNSTMKYLLAGNAEIDGDDVWISAQLTDRTTGSLLWAESYEGSRKVPRWRDAESNFARQVASTLGSPYGVIFRAETARLRSTVTSGNLDAYDCTLSYYSYRMILDRPTHASVKNCLKRAVEQFPGYTTGWALLSLIYIDEFRFRYGKSVDSRATLDRAIEAASRAVYLDPMNVRGLQAQMLALFFDNEVEEALKVGERAMALNPNDPELISAYGLRLALSGEWTKGCTLIAQALERGPAPRGYREMAMALCAYMQRDYQKAAMWIHKAHMAKNPAYHFIATAIYGQLGDVAAARREHRWILANAPELLKDVHRELVMRIKQPRDQEHFLDGLNRANIGVPGRMKPVHADAAK